MIRWKLNTTALRNSRRTDASRVRVGDNRRRLLQPVIPVPALLRDRILRASAGRMRLATHPLVLPGRRRVSRVPPNHCRVQGRRVRRDAPEKAARKPKPSIYTYVAASCRDRPLHGSIQGTMIYWAIEQAEQMTRLLQRMQDDPEGKESLASKTPEEVLLRRVQAVVGGLQRMVEELNEELPFSMRFEIEIKEHAEEFRNQ
jgi:hypothetical protein